MSLIVISPGLIVAAVMVAVTAVAAITDWRDEIIPNWLTLPALVLGLAVHTVAFGALGLVSALLGAVLCGLLPYILFRQGALGGGDVKLLAALGALGGAGLGMEAQVLSLLVAAGYAMLLLAKRGRLLGMLGNAGRLVVNPILPAKWRRPVTPETMTSMRLGAPICAGTLLAVINQYAVLW
jgi:prepilin peptidase CpaA